MLVQEKNDLIRRVGIIESHDRLSQNFRNVYGTDFNVIRSAIETNLIKTEAIDFIKAMTEGKVPDKKTYTATITFEYDADEGAPLTGEEISHPDHALQAVRDELDNGEITIDVQEFINGEPTYSIQGEW